MSEVKTVTYETARDHVSDLISKHPDLALKEVCRWIGKDKDSQYHYIWQVLDGRYGRSKRSPKIVKQLAKKLQEKGYWYEIGNIPENIESKEKSDN